MINTLTQQFPSMGRQPKMPKLKNPNKYSLIVCASGIDLDKFQLPFKICQVKMLVLTMLVMRKDSELQESMMRIRVLMKTMMVRCPSGTKMTN